MEIVNIRNVHKAKKSNIAGTLKSVEIENKAPAKKRFFGVSFLEKMISKAGIVDPIMKSSLFTIFPSRSGSVVSRINIVLARRSAFLFVSKTFSVSFQKSTTVVVCQIRSVSLNQKRDPAIAAIK